MKKYIFWTLLMIVISLITYELIEIQKRISYFNSNKFKTEALALYISVQGYYNTYRELPETKKDFEEALEIGDIIPKKFQLLKYGISFYIDTANQYIYYYSFGIDMKNNHMKNSINGNSDTICKNLIDYFKKEFFSKKEIDYRLWGFRILTPCEFSADYFFSKDVNNFDRNNIKSLIDELTYKFNSNYFKFDRYDTLIYTNDYVLNFIKFEKKNNKFSFELQCSEYFEWNEGAIPDYHSAENTEFLDSLFKYYKKNYDTFKLTGQSKIIFTVRYQIQWMEKLNSKLLKME